MEPNKSIHSVEMQQIDMNEVSNALVEFDKPQDNQEYPSGLSLATIMLAICFAVYCVALDNTIIATAIPRITDHFKKLEDAGWYGSAYLITTCAFQLFYGKLYTLYSLKAVFLSSLLLFEVGSLICAVAKTSLDFIVGRAIAGLGGAGVLCGSLVIVSVVVPLRKRASFTGLIGGCFGIAAVSGPLIGGVLTDRVSWRWCFYINLPFGAVTALVLIFFLHIHGQRPHTGTFREQIVHLDIPGNILFIASVICLLLALQWGGVIEPWSSGRVVALLVMFAVLLLAFIAVQRWRGDTATVPWRVAKQRSMAFGSIFAFMIGAAFFLFVFYLPYYFQAIKNTSALRSGIDVLPLILSQVVGTILAGALTTQTGYYMPFICLSTVFMSVGAGLITLLEVDTSVAKWVGYQIVFGIGAGLGFQQVTLAAQAVLTRKDVPTGTGIAMFVQLFGGAVFVSAGLNVFTSTLITEIVKAQVPGLDPAMIVSAGATELRRLVAPEYVGVVLKAYMRALVKTYQVGVVVACLSGVGAVGMEWVNIKGKQLDAIVAA
ncbi:putative MFS multidrug transporter [Delitschia confertaspora ATCC 74209]|uniref:MFS multidrug transporter n=1 Tax=Delitschia confertaspora ATCC 74209 TaxID=1513339 RepID=A0A9P4JW39_9PLEO|nr:putative MFS multidrug transporter [Delitschia confertaspora ATCC 74209]